MFEKQQKLQENKTSSSEPFPKQCNCTSLEIEFSLETQTGDQTESASASRKMAREDKEERRLINNHSLETLMISFMLIIQQMYQLELHRGKSHKKNVCI
ncbi:hypothetical protein Bca4012_087048 [Brassica carinata]